MSINSIFRTMSNAEKLSIGDIVKGVQTGSIPSYVGIPLIEKKTKEAQKLQMAQALMRQIQGGPPSTVTDQVMQAADQVTRPEVPPTTTLPATDRQRPAPSMGIESADSNMPQEYAGGGIIAFADRGQVRSPDDEVNPLSDITTLMGPSNWPITPLYKKAAAYPGIVEEAGMSPSTLYKLVTGRRDKPAMEFAPEDSLLEVGDVGRQAPMTPPQAQPAPQAQPQTPAGPTTPARPKYDIERGQEAPPDIGAPKNPAASAFSGIEDIYKSYLDRSRADRDELRSMILGQKADRAEQEAENRNVAMMKAGFGMMAGQSPFAGVNIGRGAMEGAESYGRGLEQLRKDDRSVIQQLASLGLKGQELEQAAMKMGVDMSHYKMLEPYYQSAAMENVAKSGLYPAQRELYGAEAAHQLASANEANMRTALLPGEQDIKRLKQVASGYKGTPGAGQFMSKLQEWRRGAYMDPASSGVTFDAEITKGLTYPKDSPTYQRALAGARSAIDSAFAQNVREFQYVGGSREGGSSSSE